MPNVSIAVSAQDNFSTAIKSMSQVTRGFSKDAEDMQKKLNMLNKNKVSLKVDADKAQSELAALAKQFSKTGDEADGLKMQLANENFENIRRNLGLVTKGAREVEKAMISAGGAISKTNNRAFSKSSIMETLAAAGAMTVGSDMLAGISQTMVGSAFGSEASSMFSSVISGIGTGAAIGNAILPGGVGATVGGGVGLAVGVINGETQNFQRKDDAFKSVVQSEYERLQQGNSSMVTSGIDIAASREMDKIAFGKLYGNDIVGAAQQDWAIETANETPFLYEDIKAISKTLATYGYSSQDTRKAVMQIGDTGAALGMSTQDMSMVATGLGRMQSTGKTTMEYMNLLIERGIPASEYLAEAYSKTQGEIAEMVSKGLIPGAEAAKIIADSMGEVNAGAMEQMSKTFTGLSSTLQGWEQEFQNAAGAGYLEIRTPAQEKQVEHYDMMGNKYEEAAGVSGKLMAVQENRQARILREQMTSLFDSPEYKTSMGDINTAETELLNAEANGDSTLIAKAEDNLAAALVETQRLVDEAEGRAEARFKGSDMEKAIEQSDSELLTALRGFLKEGDTWQAWGYNIGIEMGKGMMSVQPENAMVPSNFASNYLTGEANVPNNPNTASTYLTGGGTTINSLTSPAKQAFGMNYVPYDNFPALLHQGERVLTASEARAASTTTPTINITGNNFTVREEADVDRIAAELLKNLQKARFTYAP